MKLLNNKAIMKTLMRNILLLVAMFTISSTAMGQTLRDASYNYVGKISPNGTVRNNKYDAVGFFNNDGTIANAKGKVVGRFDHKMQIFSKSGERLGYINADGSVNDGESNLLGKIELKTGKVTNASGDVLGYANGISIQRVAAYYFFDFFKPLK